MGFQHVDRVDGILGHPLAVYKLHGHGSIHDHVSKEVSITADGGLRSTHLNFYTYNQSCIPWEKKDTLR